MCTTRREGDRLCAEESIRTGRGCVGECADGDAGHPLIGLAVALGTAVADLSVCAAHAHSVPGIGGSLYLRRARAEQVHGCLYGPQPGIGVTRSRCQVKGEVAVGNGGGFLQTDAGHGIGSAQVIGARLTDGQDIEPLVLHA